MFKEKENRFVLRKRISSTNHALRGVSLFFKNTHNARLYLFFICVVGYLGYVLNVSNTEWTVLILTTALILTAEAINSAIETHMDLTSPEEHPHARDTKDLAAGAVLIAVFLGGIIGMIIFLPKVFALF